MRYTKIQLTLNYLKEASLVFNEKKQKYIEI